MEIGSGEMRSPLRYYFVMGMLLGFITAFLLLDRFGMEAGPVRFGFIFVVALTGGLVGALLVRLQEPAAPDPVEKSTDRAANEESGEEEVETREGGTSQMRFFAVASSRRSSSDLRTVRIRPHTAPMSPPACQLRLMIEEYDAAARVPVADGVLQKLTARDLLERVRIEAKARCPRNAENVRFQLVSYRSEGPVQENGVSANGWTFRLVDGELGLACNAVTTRHEIALLYKTMASWWKPEHEVFPEPAQALSIVRREVPEMADRELWVRVDLPSDTVVWSRRPLVIADVDVEGDLVRNLSGVQRAVESSRPSRGDEFRIEDLESFCRGGEAEHSADFLRALREQEFADGLRTLQPGAMRRFALGLPETGLSERLAQRIADLEEREERKALVHVLAHVPSGSAIAVLQRIAATDRDGEVKAVADSLATDRRRGKLTGVDGLVESMDFASIRRAMGKGETRAVPLRSAYEVEDEIIRPLAALGLKVTRRQTLAGSQPLLLAAGLRPDKGDTEGLLTSNPLPVPCHVLHVVGSAAQAYLDRVEATDLVYRDEEIRRDALSDKPHEVFRAALYLAAMHRPAPEDGQKLIAAFRRARTDRNLRRAVLLGLEFTPSHTVTAFLETVRDEGEGPIHEIATAVLGRRSARARAGAGLSTSSVPIVPEESVESEQANDDG